MLGISRDKKKSFFTPLGQEGMFERDKKVPPVEASSPVPSVKSEKRSSTRPTGFTFHHGSDNHKVFSYHGDGRVEESNHNTVHEAHQHARKMLGMEEPEQAPMHEFGRDTTPPVGFISAG